MTTLRSNLWYDLLTHYDDDCDEEECIICDLVNKLSDDVDNLNIVETISQPKHAWDRPGFIISTNKSGLLKYIATRKTQRYIIEVTDMKTYTGCVVFDYELYDGGIES